MKGTSSQKGLHLAYRGGWEGENVDSNSSKLDNVINTLPENRINGRGNKASRRLWL